MLFPFFFFVGSNPTTERRGFKSRHVNKMLTVKLIREGERIITGGKKDEDNRKG